jgi:hypothetical protein
MVNSRNLTLMEEHRLKSLEITVLRITFGLKREEIMGDWRKLHNEELHNLHSLRDMIRMIKSRRKKRAGHVVRMGEKKNACRILMGKP